jgi:cytochrome c553
MIFPLRFVLSAALALCAAAPAIAYGQSAPTDNPAAIEFFEKKIRPLLVDNCHTCHSAETNSRGGLRVDDRNGLVVGGESGPAVVPGDAEKSLLIKAVRYLDEDLKMPPKKQLSAEQVADLTKWIQEGAAWPSAQVSLPIGQANPQYESLRKEHWSWQRLGESKPPAVRQVGWARDSIDLFILARLEERGLDPVGDADKLTLIRRLSFDLAGLPPTPGEINAFIADNSSDALDKVVDRLLASPAFGEKWGRHWLDVARYGESTGSSRNIPLPHAWRYRDYVIDALNADKPYDQFIREQIAGDLLPAVSEQERDEHLIATGFLALGVKDVNQRFKVRFIMDNIDEQIDTVSRSVLALTASCARCHDHKFDPIPTADYYALAGIFHSTDLCAGVRNKMGGGGLDYYDTQMLLRVGPQPASTPEAAGKIEELNKQLVAARGEFEALRGKPEGNEPGPDGRPKRAIARQKVNKLQNELLALSDPAAGGGQAAFGVRDSKTVGDTEIRIRGEAEKMGPVVPRGFLSLPQFTDAPRIAAGQSGRLELAVWLTSPHNPLTLRVITNRVWKHLFGQGLVKTVDNFGVTGDTPSHPELLDHLAARFVYDGWSIKRLVRTIVLSRAYRLGSEAPAANVALDPANRWIWRHSPRRLEAEEIRDATLAAAGSLELSRAEASPVKDFKVVELRNNGPEARRLQAAARASRHRGIYLPLLRGLTPTSLEVFDFAEQGMVTGSRDTTTVAPQALYLLNDPFVRREALALANRLLGRGDCDDVERVNLAYRLTLGRTATSWELERVLRYVADYEGVARQILAQPANPSGSEVVVAVAETGDAAVAAGSEATTKKKPAPKNPDEADQSDEPAVEEVIQPASSQAAAWASFCQALLGSAEFRYLQ